MSLIQDFSSITLEKRESRVKEYVQEGRKLSDWEVWTALETYMQVRENMYFKFCIENVLGSHFSLNYY